MGLLTALVIGEGVDHADCPVTHPNRREPSEGTDSLQPHLIGVRIGDGPRISSDSPLVAIRVGCVGVQVGWRITTGQRRDGRACLDLDRDAMPHGYRQVDLDTFEDRPDPLRTGILRIPDGRWPGLEDTVAPGPAG